MLVVCVRVCLAELSVEIGMYSHENKRNYVLIYRYIKKVIIILLAMILRLDKAQFTYNALVPPRSTYRPALPPEIRMHDMHGVDIVPPVDLVLPQLLAWVSLALRAQVVFQGVQ